MGKKEGCTSEDSERANLDNFGMKAATAAAEKRGALKVTWMKGHAHTVSETCGIAKRHMQLPHCFVSRQCAHVKLDSCSFDPSQHPRLDYQALKVWFLWRRYRDVRRKRVRPSLSVLHLKPFQYLHLLDLTRCKQTQLSLRSGTNPETWHLVFISSFLFLLGIDGVLMVLRYREALVLMPQVIFRFPFLFTYSFCTCRLKLKYGHCCCCCRGGGGGGGGG